MKENKNTRSLSAKPTPIAHGGDMVTWAAWLYYSQDRTQNNVAAELGISRASVANYLAEARARGLVKISLDPNLLAKMQLGQTVSARFNLQETHVIPTSDDAFTLRKNLGIAGANILAERVGATSVLGVAWGRTMLELAQALAEKKLPTMRVVQVSGSSLGDEEIAPEFCTALIASRLGAKCSNFHAPAIVSSQQMRSQLMAEPALIKHFDLIESCDTVVFSVAGLDETTFFADPGTITPKTTKDYMDRGAVGLALGQFIGADGDLIDGELAGRVIGLSVQDLTKIPIRICIAGGAEKVTVLKAILKKGFATHLVSDALTVRGLLEE